MYNDKLLNNFLEYIKIDTQANASSNTIPSNTKELDLINLLEKQLKKLDIKYYRDQYGFISAIIPSNTNKEVASIGFLAHVDTAPDYSGTNVNPQIINDYQGQDIILSNNDVLSPNKFSSLNDSIGHTIVTTDGNTLLGADDKSGVAIIMNVLEYFNDNKDLEHGDIYAAFTLDEEIGTGVDNFDLSYFKPDFAYTIDGGAIGELNYETFNAASLNITFHGLNVHPGSAKDIMINSLELANEFHSHLPKLDRPEYTNDYQGFYMLMNLKGNVEKTEANYIIRDHKYDVFEYRKDYIKNIINNMKAKYKNIDIEYKLEDQYYNMANKIMDKKIAINLAKKAMELNDIKCNIIPIRGGTDGSKLSFKGIPCPNLFTGGYNFHGKYEYLDFNMMIKARDVVIDIIKLNLE